MSEQIDLVAALKQQQAHLKRLLELKIWVSNAPEATVEEMKEQISQIKSLIQELEELFKPSSTSIRRAQRHTVAP